MEWQTRAVALESSLTCTVAEHGPHSPTRRSAFSTELVDAPNCWWYPLTTVWECRLPTYSC